MECLSYWKFLSTRSQVFFFQKVIELRGNSRSQCSLWFGCASTHLRWDVDYSASWLTLVKEIWQPAARVPDFSFFFLRLADLVLTLYHCGEKKVLQFSLEDWGYT